MCRHVASRRDGFFHRHPSENAVGEDAAVYERGGEQGDEATDLGVLQHHFSVFALRHGPPIGLDVLDAPAYVTDVRQQRAVLETRQHPVAEGTELTQLRLQLLGLVQEDTQSAGHHGTDDQKDARYEQNVRQDLLLDRRLRHRPDANRLQQPPNRLYAIFVVLHVTQRGRRSRDALHVYVANART